MNMRRRESAIGGGMPAFDSPLFVGRPWLPDREPLLALIATAHAVSRAGLTPVFADVNPLTHNLDPEAVERAVTPRTSAILGVHLWGRPCDIVGLSAVAERH